MRHAITRAEGVKDKALRERNRAIALEIHRSTWNIAPSRRLHLNSLIPQRAQQSVVHN